MIDLYVRLGLLIVAVVLWAPVTGAVIALLGLGFYDLLMRAVKQGVWMAT